MKNEETLFQEFKTKSLEKLEKAIKRKEVDEHIIPLLHRINKNKSYCTTSSCAGRMIILQLPEVGDKKQAVYLGRWHRSISVDNIIKSLDNYQKGQVWFITQSPIFHIAVQSFFHADELLRLGLSAGFKHSGYKTGKHRIIVEFCSTERMDVPLGINGNLYITDAYLHVLVELGNDLLQRSQKKLDRLKQLLE